MKRVLATACLLTVLAGCASWRTPTLEVSGQTLAALGNQFAKVSEVFSRGCAEPRSIPVQACTDFRTFGVNFKKSYPLLVGLWEAAREANDASAQKSTQQLVTQLASQLASLAAQGIAAYGGN